MWWNCAYYVSKKSCWEQTQCKLRRNCDCCCRRVRLPLYAVSMHVVRTIIKDNEGMETARKGRMMAVVSTVKWEPLLANKCSDKDASVENSGHRNSRFKIFKSYMFITMCQLTISSYVKPKWNGPNPLEVDPSDHPYCCCVHSSVEGRFDQFGNKQHIIFYKVICRN